MTHTKPLPAVGNTSTVPHKLEKPRWINSDSLVRIAGYALGVLAVGYAARALYLVCSGVSVLAPALAVSVALSTICCVAFYHLRADTNAVAALRKAVLGAIKAPEVPRPEVVNQDANTLSYKEFCLRHGVEAVARITDEESLRKLFESFLYSRRRAYIRPGFSQQEYEATLSHFMRPSFREEFQRKWDEELPLAQVCFLNALYVTETYQFDFGGALAAFEDPGKRLGFTLEEVYRRIVPGEFATFTLGAFVRRNGFGAFKYLSRAYNVVDKFEEFVDIEREKNPSITPTHFDSYIDDICVIRADLRTGLVACVQKKFTQPPPPASPAPVSTTTVAAPAASSSPLMEEAYPSQQYKRAFLAQLMDENYSLSRVGMGAIFTKADAERLSITLEEIAPLVVDRELRRCTYKQFIDRNGLHAVSYVSDGSLLREKFIAHVTEMHRLNPSFTLEDFRSDIDAICKPPANRHRQPMDRLALQQEVASLCARAAAARM